MVGAGTVGEESTEKHSVYVPRQPVSKELSNEGGYAYWIGFILFLNIILMLVLDNL